MNERWPVCALMARTLTPVAGVAKQKVADLDSRVEANFPDHSPDDPGHVQSEGLSPKTRPCRSIRRKRALCVILSEVIRGTTASVRTKPF